MKTSVCGAGAARCGVMGRRMLLLSCARTVAIFLLGFTIGGVFNLLLSASLPVHHYSSPAAGPGGADIQDVLQGETPRMGELLERQQTLPSPPLSLLKPGENPESPRVLCYILVGPSTHRTAIHVKNTWGQRCDRLVFFSSSNDTSLQPDVLDVPEGYGYLWAKTKAGLTHLHENYPDYHWYLKADDDTYVIIENLRYFLQGRDPNVPVYYGVKFRRFVKQGYMSGGGGYVLSREALRRFVTEALVITDQDKCATNSVKGSEDLQLGKCLESVGVAAGDSLDETGRSRFFSHGPQSLFFKQPLINRLHWYWHYIWHPHTVGPDCCSRHIISFHNIDPRMMWVLETLLYRLNIHRDLQPPGLNTSTSTLPPPVTSTITTS
ncbi:glycoprotein-N-acetylgalactosamine 3-beta-galactosyltransferase 1-like isoform X2 [Portunus trituberculatus]|uniref:glycoprotein-N-acetylgalactosamine 3-beta-galactosyltransferase 1-like isoform X2 n=1 Tax=Portunus trituberculatus TaxID=210409 RepID=UPI001E1CE05A|nr:glycoprotein-N-acetylgalactosamine 3-beta-galactosyltransferase 1-like isoform X2 [Portunus trituberculatus]XP_045120844.1 glycoprotein-N-acetylgalactosamine 3-beta-galactosyltransferase 1-like isoform X2 [Portunus trituberculatus]